MAIKTIIIYFLYVLSIILIVHAYTIEIISRLDFFLFIIIWGILSFVYGLKLEPGTFIFWTHQHRIGAWVALWNMCQETQRIDPEFEKLIISCICAEIDACNRENSKDWLDKTLGLKNIHYGLMNAPVELLEYINRLVFIKNILTGEFNEKDTNQRS